MNTNNIKLSIIIPHYNYPEGLRKLLSTIPDKNEIQVIVVDDVSTENLDELEVVKKDFSVKNVEFYDNTWDKGAGNCRNIGLTKAKGEWYLFADADDTFTEGFYDVVSEYFNKEHDLVLFKPTSIYVETGELAKRHELHCKCYDNYLKNPTHKNLIIAVDKPVTPWSKLIRASVVKDNNIQFANTRVGNDVLFSVRVATSTNKYYVSDKTIYCVSDRKGSLTTKYDEATLDIRRQVFIDHYKLLKANRTKKEFNYMEYSGLSYYVFALKYGPGIKKFKELNKDFKKNYVRRIYLPEIWHKITNRLFEKR